MKKLVPFTKEIEFKTMISKVTSISLEHTLRVENDNLISGYFIVEGTYKMTQASQIDEEFSYKIPVDIEIDDKYDTSNLILDIDDFTYEIIDEEIMKLNITLCIDNLEEKKDTKPILLDEEEIIEDFEPILEEDEKERTEDKKEESEEIIEENTSLNETEEAKEIDKDTRDNITDGILDDLFMDTSKDINLEFSSSLKKDKKEEQADEIKADYNMSINTDTLEENPQQSNSITNNGVESLFSSFKDNAETFKTYSVYIVKEEDTIETILLKYNVSREDLEEYNNLSEVRVGSKVIVPSSSKNE